MQRLGHVIGSAPLSPRAPFCCQCRIGGCGPPGWVALGLLCSDDLTWSRRVACSPDAACRRAGMARSGQGRRWCWYGAGDDGALYEEQVADGGEDLVGPSGVVVGGGVGSGAVCLVVEAADPYVAVGIFIVDEGGGDGHALGLLVGDDDVFHVAHPFRSAPGAGLVAADLVKHL